MKRILVSLFAIALVSFANKSMAQCNGATVTITNFIVLAPGNTVIYSFDWQFVQGNASLQVTDSCNGVFVQASDCIPRLKDSAAGPHHVIGTFPTTCSGALTVAVIIWTNPTCGGTSCTAVARTIAHTPLPVTFASFNAERNRNSVSLKWETATEVNSRGFAIERNTNGVWQQVGYVNSQAQGFNGMSSNPLNYTFTDLNDARGMSQYRIRQEDIDMKSKYSEIRSIRGDGQIGKIIVFPNPSNDGKVNISFENGTDARVVSVVDMSGRTVKEFKGVTNNSLIIENLQAGFYTLKVSIPATGEQAVQKIVVNKR